MDSTSLVINRPHVVDETIDEETILINLDTGIYYSLDGPGTVVWQTAAQGGSIERVADLLADVYAGAEQDVRGDVHALVAELVAEGLLREGELGRETPTITPPATARDAYASPVLHKYTDMQAFLLADPLHDVDEGAGWPHVKPS